MPAQYPPIYVSPSRGRARKRGDHGHAARGKWLIGLALTQSMGEGGSRETGSALPPPVGSASSSMGGKVESSLAVAIPYAS